MKKAYLFLLVNILVFTKNDAQTFEWAKKGGLWAYDYGYGVSTDNAGNVYVAGKFELNADFRGQTLPCAGNHDIYVAQYSSSGTLNWIQTGGGTLGDYAHALTCDGSAVYICGEIEGSGTIQFPGSSITLQGHGDNDGFVAKYDLNGTLLWATDLGGGGNDKALGISYDAAGNTYVCGRYTGVAYFGTQAISGFGDIDIFVTKLDPNGNVLWVRNAGSADRDEALGIKCDALGNAYVCGMYHDGATFGSTTLAAPKPSGGGSYMDMFLAKYDKDGTLKWVKNGGGDYDDVGWSVTMDNAGKIFVAGEFNADGNFGGTHVYTVGNADVFVACYNSSGAVQWVQKGGGKLIDRARGIACDGENLYISGQFGGTASFGSYPATAADSSDIFVASLTNNGAFRWAMAAGGVADSLETLGYESGDGICATSTGDVYSTGAMLNGASFGPTDLSPYKRTDMFLAKIHQNGIIINNIAQHSAGSTFSIYPNPGNGMFTIAAGAELKGNVSIIIYNALGQVVLEKTYEDFANARFNMSDKEKGVYFVRLRSVKEEINTKLVIQ